MNFVGWHSAARRVGWQDLSDPTEQNSEYWWPFRLIWKYARALNISGCYSFRFKKVKILNQRKFCLFLHFIDKTYTVMAALFACTKCHSRHPFEDLSPSEQLCKVSDLHFCCCPCHMSVIISYALVICNHSPHPQGKAGTLTFPC